MQGLLGSLGIQLGAGIPVGVTCSPITAVGIAGNSWCVSFLRGGFNADLHSIFAAPSSLYAATTTISMGSLPSDAHPSISTFESVSIVVELGRKEGEDQSDGHYNSGSSAYCVSSYCQFILFILLRLSSRTEFKRPCRIQFGRTLSKIYMRSYEKEEMFLNHFVSCHAGQKVKIVFDGISFVRLL